MISALVCVGSSTVAGIVPTDRKQSCLTYNMTYRVVQYNIIHYIYIGIVISRSIRTHYARLYNNKTHCKRSYKTVVVAETQKRDILGESQPRRSREKTINYRCRYYYYYYYYYYARHAVCERGLIINNNTTILYIRTHQYSNGTSVNLYTRIIISAQVTCVCVGGGQTAATASRWFIWRSGVG